jgi:hypothetical protein
MPKNCCAFQVVFDSLEKSNILKYLVVEDRKLDPLIELLSGSKKSSYEKAISCIIN